MTSSRYDGRGHLYDLHLYDAANVAAGDKQLSEEDQRIEALCDEERYLELHTDMAEKIMYEGKLQFLHLYKCCLLIMGRSNW